MFFLSGVSGWKGCVPAFLSHPTLFLKDGKGLPFICRIMEMAPPAWADVGAFIFYFKFWRIIRGSLVPCLEIWWEVGAKSSSLLELFRKNDETHGRGREREIDASWVLVMTPQVLFVPGSLFLTPYSKNKPPLAENMAQVPVSQLEFQTSCWRRQLMEEELRGCEQRDPGTAVRAEWFGVWSFSMSQIPLVLNYLNQEFMLGRIWEVQKWDELEERAWIVNLCSPKEFPSGDQGLGWGWSCVQEG